VIELETIRERLDDVTPPVRAAQVEELNGFIGLVELDVRMMLNRLDLLIEIRDGWGEASASSPAIGHPRRRADRRPVPLSPLDETKPA